MEEELNENDLEERLYAMIHHVDETQENEKALPSEDANPRVETPHSTLRRYWRSSYNSAYQKTNAPRDAAPPARNTPAAGHKTAPAAPVPLTSDNTPKEENRNAPVSPPSELLVLKYSIPQNYVKTVEILDIDEPSNFIELESSDEDEVIEVKLPPKPTITIESSDEEELVQKLEITTTKKALGKASKENKSPNKSNRDVSASPVPSVVSTMSDEFIRGDCIALNISSAQPDNESFDFSLHGSDLLGDATPSKKKKKKKSKDRLTSTPISGEPNLELKKLDNIFVTPKGKAKNKKKKTKSYAVSEKRIPNADVYNSDSNQSFTDNNKNHDVYIVTDKSFPSADVYESDSSIVETVKDKSKLPSEARKQIDFAETSDSNISMEISVVPDSQETNQKQPKTNSNQTDNIVIDLREDFTANQNMIREDFVMGNVTGFTESEDYGDDSVLNNSSAVLQEHGKFCSTKIPQILNEDLDFDNLKGKNKVCSRRRYSLTTLRAEMEKFYNESWGGENFNHQEIQKNMSRDKSLWVIDPKDRMAIPPKRRVTCNYCNRPGHRDDACRSKPPVCHMCGDTGHYEPRCPRKICVNCGSPNFVYSAMCRNCAPWARLRCAECGRAGHPASHCPDLWRRYHNSIDENMPLEVAGEKPPHQQFCSGCARRGHLVHACRACVPFGPVPPPAAGVARYRPLYPPADAAPPGARKRLSRSPAHEAHNNKKRMSETEDPKIKANERPPNREHVESAVEESIHRAKETERAADYIPVASANRDHRGRVIQDNEVSDTSEVVTSARVYASGEVARQLHTSEGQKWLKESMEKLQVDVRHSDSQSFLTVKGTLDAQEAFQAELREWARVDSDKDAANDTGGHDGQEKVKNTYTVPKKKNDILRTLESAFASLKRNIGDPKAMYKELMYLKNHHETLVHQKVVSPAKLSNNRDNMNKTMKKLNMVLLGQAGLADGARHLAALRALRRRLAAARRPCVPADLRAEIALHYQIIFTAAPRDDYADLLKKFYFSKRPVLAKKKKNNSTQCSPNNRQIMKKNPLQGWKVAPLIGTEGDGQRVNEKDKRHMKEMPIHVLKNKMIFYHKRLLCTRFFDSPRDQKRRALISTLQKHITYVVNTEPGHKIGQKKKRKMKKSCELTQSLLSDV